MGVRINHNAAALSIQYNLDRVSNSLNTSFNRLASGERIQRAGDDVSGLAISQALRYDIRGLQQNVRNVNNGVSVISTAESAMGQITDMLHRIRELAIAAGSPAMTDQNRRAYDIEAQELIGEIQNLARNTEFNGKNLLDGSFANMRVQTGEAAGQYVHLTIPSMLTSMLGALARVTGSSPVSNVPLTGADEVAINGVYLPATENDGVSYGAADSSAIAKARAINQVSGLTRVTAEVEPAEMVGRAAISAINIDGETTTLVINGVYMGSISAQAGDTTGALVARINMRSSETGVKASVSGGALVLRAEDGRNISIETSGGVAEALGLTVGEDNVTQGGAVTLRSVDPIAVTGDAALLGLAPDQMETPVSAATSLANQNIITYANTQAMIDTVDGALENVVGARSQLGAIQNRLEATAESLAVMVENLTGSDSRIRDTDFAQETARLTRDQILQDAAIAILAQANAMPRSVLEILMR